MPEWKIYQLTFPDGYKYIGQSVNLKKRLKDHAYDPRGPVSERLRRGEEPKVTILRKAYSQAEADTLEVAYIDRLPEERKLNRKTLRPRQKTPAPPVDGKYRCSWCLGFFAPEAMSVDRGRSRGVGSKCRECYRRYARCQRFLRDYFSELSDLYSVAYRYARGSVIAGLGKEVTTWSALRKVEWSAIAGLPTPQAVAAYLTGGN